MDLNTASAAELEALPAIGRTRARQIIRMRERNGPFRCVEELRALPRLSDRDFRRVRPLVKVSGKHARTDCSELEHRRRSPQP